MEEKERRIVERALKRIAKRDKKTVAEVRQEIQSALSVGMRDPRPSVQAYWKMIPRAGAVPTVEEVILDLAKKSRE